MLPFGALKKFVIVLFSWTDLKKFVIVSRKRCVASKVQCILPLVWPLNMSTCMALRGRILLASLWGGMFSTWYLFTLLIYVQIDMLVMIIIVLDEENENGSADIFVFEFRANLVLWFLHILLWSWSIACVELFYAIITSKASQCTLFT